MEKCGRCHKRNVDFDVILKRMPYEDCVLNDHIGLCGSCFRDTMEGRDLVQVIILAYKDSWPKVSDKREWYRAL